MPGCICECCGRGSLFNIDHCLDISTFLFIRNLSVQGKGNQWVKRAHILGVYNVKVLKIIVLLGAECANFFLLLRRVSPIFKQYSVKFTRILCRQVLHRALCVGGLHVYSSGSS